MNAEHFWCCVSTLLSMFVVLFYLVVFVDQWRFPPWQTRIMLVALSAAAMVLLVCAYLYFPDLKAAGRMGMISNLAALVLFSFLMPWRGGLQLFVISTAFVGCFFPYYIFRVPGPANLLLQVVIDLIVILLMYRYFRPLFRSAILAGNAAWPLIALVPLSFVLVHLVIVGNSLLGSGASTEPGGSVLPGVPILSLRLMMIVLPVCTYLLLCQLFGVLDRQYRAHRDHLLINSQLAALERREREGRQFRERDRTFCEELGRALDRMDGQITAGDIAGALDLADKIDGGLAGAGLAAKRQAYTGNAVLDTVLSEYIKRAKEAGVPLSMQFSLPSGWNLDSLGLAVVLSNGLENALNACGRLPADGAPAIVVTTSNTARQLMLEIRNTCVPGIAFDQLTGLPRSRQEGHGYGTRSMAAYARVNGGSLEFESEGGWFTMRLLLPLSEQKNKRA